MSWFVGLFGPNVARAFIKTVGAMAATGLTTVSAFQVVMFGKYAISFRT